MRIRHSRAKNVCFGSATTAAVVALSATTALPAAHAAEVPPAAATPVAATTDEARKNLTQLTSDTAKVTKLTQDVTDALAAADTLTANLQKATQSGTQATTDTVAQIQTIAKLLTPKLPKDVLSGLAGLVSDNGDLAKSLLVLKADKGNVTTSQTANAYVGDDIAAADKAVKAADAAATAADTTKLKAKSTDSSANLTAAVTAAYPFVHALITSLKADIDGTGLPDLAQKDPKPTPDAVRAALAHGIGLLNDEEKLRGALTSGWTTLGNLLTNDGDKDPQVNGADAGVRLTALGTTITGILGKMPGWVDTVGAGALALITSDQTAITETQKALTVIPRDRAQLAKSLQTVADTNTAIAQMVIIDRDARALPTKSPVTGLADSLTALQSDRMLLATANTLLSDAIVDDRSNWVSDQVRLFYTTDVRRILEALHPGTRVVPLDSETAAKKAADARSTLVQAEADVAEQFAKVNDLQARLAAINEKVREVNARAAAAQNDAREAHANQLEIEAQQESLTTKIAAQTAKNMAVQSDPNATPEQKTASQKLLSQLNDQQTLLGKQHDGQATVVTANDAAAKAATDEQAKLSDDKAALPLQQSTARDTLSAMQTLLASNRRKAVLLAEEEARAFGDEVNNQPYLLADPVPASSDPLARVLVYGYQDSNTIFLRGEAADVERAKEAIASFDRPAPLACVTLWTLQINGSDTGKLNEAIRSVDETLRSMRGSVTLIQDILRNSIVQEVNRVETVAYEASSNVHGFTKADPDPLREYSGRLGRCFFYPAEIRHSMGFYYEVPPLPKWAAAFFQELELVKKYFHAARESHIAAIEYTHDAEAQRKNRADREDFLRRTRYHYIQAGLALEHICAYDKNGKHIADTIALQADLNRYVHRAEEFAALVRSAKNRSTADATYSKFFVVKTIKKNNLDVHFPSTPTQDEIDLGVTIEKARNLASLLQKEAIDESKKKSSWQRYLTQEEYNDVEHVTRWTLPDPATATTLGEMLFVLSLGERRSRLRIMDNFLLQLDKIMTIEQAESQTSAPGLRKFADALVRLYGDSDSVGKSYLNQDDELSTGSWGRNRITIQDSRPSGGSKEDDPFYPYFPRTVFGSAFDLVPDEGSNQEMTANQKEIQTAILTKVRENVAGEVRRLIRTIGAAEDPVPGAVAGGDSKLLRDQYRPLVAWLHGSFFAPDQPENNISFNTTWNELGANIIGPDGIDADKSAWKIATLSWDRNSLARATPRVAAADGMIKRLIQVAENDLEHYLYQDQIDSLRKSITETEGIELGTIQKESMLTTNRKVARVDPDANASVTVPGGDNLLDSAQQLTQIVHNVNEEQRAQKLTQTAPIAAAGLVKEFGGTGAATLHRALGMGVVTSFLGDLLARPQEPAGEVYSINSGNLFQITPIFDPSGQALRFRFDYSATTRVTEPNGTVNTQIPRVERHTVNNEVELSNLEYREISSFEMNARIAHPVTRSGGLPLLNQLPVLRDIPIVGYYSRQGGGAAVRQQSIIFAQTSMYPTVGDIVDLLTDVPPRPDLENDPPKYITAKTDAAASQEFGVSLDRGNVTNDLASKPGVQLTVGLAHPADRVRSFNIHAANRTWANFTDASAVATTAPEPEISVSIPKGQQTHAVTIAPSQLDKDASRVVHIVVTDTTPSPIPAPDPLLAKAVLGDLCAARTSVSGVNASFKSLSKSETATVTAVLHLTNIFKPIYKAAVSAADNAAKAVKANKNPKAAPGLAKTAATAATKAKLLKTINDAVAAALVAANEAKTSAANAEAKAGKLSSAIDAATMTCKTGNAGTTPKMDDVTTGGDELKAAAAEAEQKTISVNRLVGGISDKISAAINTSTSYRSLLAKTQTAEAALRNTLAEAVKANTVVTAGEKAVDAAVSAAETDAGLKKPITIPTGAGKVATAMTAPPSAASSSTTLTPLNLAENPKDVYFNIVPAVPAETKPEEKDTFGLELADFNYAASVAAEERTSKVAHLVLRHLPNSPYQKFKIEIVSYSAPEGNLKRLNGEITFVAAKTLPNEFPSGPMTVDFGNPGATPPSGDANGASEKVVELTLAPPGSATPPGSVTIGASEKVFELTITPPDSFNSGDSDSDDSESSVSLRPFILIVTPIAADQKKADEDIRRVPLLLPPMRKPTEREQADRDNRDKEERAANAAKSANQKSEPPK